MWKRQGIIVQMRSLIVGASIAIAVLLGAAPANANPVVDRLFLNMVHDSGITLSDKELLELRPKVCLMIQSANGNLAEAAEEFAKKNPDWTEDQVLTLVLGAQMSYCPQKKGEVSPS